jgi:predicted  nucleic acid-binding Zn-ribbon protein
MKPAETLAEIEALDLRHQALLGEREAIAVRAKTDPTVRQLRQRRAQLEAKAQEQASALRQLELETAALGERAKSHQKAIYDGSVRHPADLQRRQHELETLRGRIAVLEETELAQMEAQEQSEAELAQIRAELAGREREVELARQADRDRAEGLAAELIAVAEERQRLVESAPTSELWPGAGRRWPGWWGGPAAAAASRWLRGCSRRRGGRSWSPARTASGFSCFER